MTCGSLLWAATRAPERFRRLVLEIPPTTGETRVAAAAMYRAGADLVQRDGKAAWVAALRQYPPPAIFAGIPGFAIEVDSPSRCRRRSCAGPRSPTCRAPRNWPRWRIRP